MQRGTKLTITAWLPMKDISTAELLRVKSLLELTILDMAEREFTDIRITDRVVSRKESKG